jgi:hypothetical protein
MANDVKWRANFFSRSFLSIYDNLMVNWRQQHEDCFSSAVCRQDSIGPQQGASLLPSMEFMTAAAQPTPACTDNAPVGQLRLHAPHSMQASLFLIHTRPMSFIAITAWGQTSVHMPQPMHFSSLRSSVTTSFR